MINEDLRGKPVINSLDVIQRIEDLEIDEDSLDDYEEEELAGLKALSEEAAKCAISEWEDGCMLISDDYFVEYAKEFTSDVCGMKHDLEWPYCHVDWDAAADSLKQDYTSVKFAGDTYWVR